MIKEMVKVPQYTCMRCGNVWISRIKGIPKRCPLCLSPYWHTKKVKFKKEKNNNK